jgi:hypothetical protein
MLSARDPAAACAIKNVAICATQNPGIDILILASSPALQILEDLPCKIKPIESSVSRDLKLLRKIVRSMINSFLPDAIVVGSSGPDAGVDEVLIEQSEQVRSYVIQDYWGDVNEQLSAYADCYFVMDSFADKLTRNRTGKETCIVGSVKHEHYAQLDPVQMRVEGRKLIGIDKSQRVLGYFGMPLGDHQGYWRTIEYFCEVLKGNKDWTIIFFRPHPKESAHNIRRTLKLLESAGIHVFFDKGDSPEQAILSCDLVCSCYSSCGFDNILLNCVAGQLTNISMFLLFDQQLYSYFKQYTKLTDIPYADQGIAISVKNKIELNSYFKKSLSEDYRNSVEEQIKNIIPPLVKASERLLNKVVSDCLSN